MNERQAVIDTNVVVAALLTAEKMSPTARILDAMLAAEISHLVSVELLAEYREVLLRDRVCKLHQLAEDEVDRILTEIALNAIVVEPEGTDRPAPDAGDQHLWNLSASRVGTVLVTGDRRLVKEPPPRASVVSPHAFLEMR